MRLSFNMMCLVAAAVACKVGGSSVDQIEDPTKQHLRIQEPAQEERGPGGNPNQFARMEILDLGEKSGVEKLGLGEKSGVEKLGLGEKSRVEQFILEGSSEVENALKKSKLEVQRIQQAANDLSPRDIRMANKLLFYWKNKLDVFNAEKGNPPVTLLGFLMYGFGDEGAAAFIKAAMKDLAASPIARQLNWLRNNRKPKKFLKDLAGDKEVVNLFDIEGFSEWINYVDAFNKQYPHQAKSMLRLLKKYKNKDLVSMLYTGETNPITSPAKETLRKALFESWHKKGYGPNFVYTFFDFDPNKPITLREPRFGAWQKYKDELEKIKKLAAGSSNIQDKKLKRKREEDLQELDKRL